MSAADPPASRVTQPRSGRGARTKARKRALDIVFESEQRGLRLGATLDERRESDDPPVSDYTVALVEGVSAHQSEIDQLISLISTDWTLDRMPAVDRAILRLAIYEVVYVDEVPTAVAIDEAVKLARELSTDESPAFVNGILGHVEGTPMPAPLAPLPEPEPDPDPEPGPEPSPQAATEAG